MISLIQLIHLLAAGVWLGGLVFTIAVVSPAFKRMAWSPSDRIAVRSELGRQYAKVARVNLAILTITLVTTGAMTEWPWDTRFEIALVVVTVVLSEMHARFFAPRLAQSAVNGEESRRRRLMRISIGVSMLNLVISTFVAILATKAGALST